MFWALEQRQKRMAAMREEERKREEERQKRHEAMRAAMVAQVKREIGDEVKQDLLDQAQRIMIEQAKREFIERIEPITKAKGIPTEELIKALDETPANPKA